MTFAEFFSLLYPVVPLVALIGFVPQIGTLIKTQSSPQSVSLSSWSTWTLTWVISIGYAAFYLQDIPLFISSSINLCANFTIVAVTIYKRRKYAGLSFSSLWNDFLRAIMWNKPQKTPCAVTIETPIAIEK